MAKSSFKSEKITAKLRKLSKDELAKQAHEKRMAYNDLIAPYVGKPIIEVPKQVFDRAVELLREAEAADKEWFRLSGIAR